MVELTGCLVEEQDTWTAVDRPRQQQTLRLAAGQAAVRAGEWSMHGHRHALDVFPYSSKFGCFPNAPDVGIRLEARYIIGNGAFEQPVGLQHDAELPAQRAAIPESRIHAVVADPAAIGFQ